MEIHKSGLFVMIQEMLQVSLLCILMLKFRNRMDGASHKANFLYQQTTYSFERRLTGEQLREGVGFFQDFY